MADTKIEKCPYCGGECKISNMAQPDYVVCENRGCRYCSANSVTRAAAIAAHNKVSNAVATQSYLLDAMDELLALWRCDPGDSAERNIVEAAIRKTKEKTDG